MHTNKFALTHSFSAVGFILGFLLVCTSPVFAVGVVICPGTSGYPAEPYEDLNSDGCFDTVSDTLGIKAALEAGGTYVGGSGAGLVIPKGVKVRCANNASCDWQFDGKAIILGSILGTDANIKLSTGLEQDISGAALLTRASTLTLESQNRIALAAKTKITSGGNIEISALGGNCDFSELAKIKSSTGTISVDCSESLNIGDRASLDGAAGLSLNAGSSGVGALTVGEKVKLISKKLPSSFVSVNAPFGSCTALSRLQIAAIATAELNCDGDIVFGDHTKVMVDGNTAQLEFISANGLITLGPVSNIRLKGSSAVMTVDAAGDISFQSLQIVGTLFNYSSATGGIAISGIARARGVPDMLHNLTAPAGLCDTSLLKTITPGSSAFFYNCQQVSS